MVARWCFDNGLFRILASQGGYQVAKFSLLRSELDSLILEIVFYPHFFSRVLLPNSGSNPYSDFSFPFYTLLLVDPSWWWNIPLVRGSLHLWDLSGSLSLYHCSYMSRHVLEVRLKLWYWEDFLVSCVYCWILCSASGFSQSTTLYPWQRQILVSMLMSRWIIFNYAFHSQGGSYSSFPLQ